MTNQPIAEFISHLHSLNVQILTEGDRDVCLNNIRLHFTAPNGVLTNELRQELRDRKAELVAYLRGAKAAVKAPGADTQPKLCVPSLPAPITPSPHHPITPTFPLSFAQQRLWFLSQLAPDNPFYNVPAAIRLIGTLDQTALERSFNEIVRRHATLRTTFTMIDGQPVQTIQPHVTITLSTLNLSTVAVNERERVSCQLATTEAQQPFNLTTDPLLRLTLLKFDDTDATLLLTLHHIIADGWSLGVLIRELACCYKAFVEGRSPALPPLPIQYTDFVSWQRNWLQGEVLAQQLAYWRRQLQDLPVLDLPGDRPRPATQSYRGATYPVQISAPLTQALIALSQQAGTSLFMTLLAAFQTLLHRYTGQHDIAIGSPIANRHRSEVEGLIGFFVNSLVLRSRLTGNLTFRELLEQVRNTALEAYEHQDLPFEKLVEALAPDRDLNRNPLFQIAFALQNAPMQSLELPGLTLEPTPFKSGSTRFDLEVHLWEPAHGLHSLWHAEAGLSGFITYSTDLFDPERIGRLIGHFQTLLAGVVANPDARLSDLPLLTPPEYQQLLFAWNRSPQSPLNQGAALPTHRGFHQIFAAQVQLAPGAIALVTEQATLSYRELDQKANQLAQMLQQMGVQPNALVGLCVDRSADMVIGILGIFKAGGAYVPIDPNYPSDRIQFILDDTQVKLLLTQSWLVKGLPTSAVQVLCLDQTLRSQPLGTHDSDPLTERRPFPPIEPSSNTTPSNTLAYVIYTSGSTGTPKGVLLSQRGLCNVVAAQQQVFHLSQQSRVLQFSSLSFDASIFEMTMALGCGGTLYIPPQTAQLPGLELTQFLQTHAITHALLTPSVLAVLPTAALPALEVLITGGETCPNHVIDHWAVGRHFFNAYGPTESTIWATVAALVPGDNPLTIGHPILNTQVYILDTNLKPVPISIPGELYIGGAGVAQGYLNRPELTEAQFIDVGLPMLDSDLELDQPPIPIEQSQNLKLVRLYKTGDRAQYRPNGTIEFLGRVDHQIKIRGFRVELGEIEAVLKQHPAIQDGLVITTGQTTSHMRLVAYFSINRQHYQQTILQSLQTQQIQHWQTLYNQTYQPSNPNPQFNTTGWHSSYTGNPIPLTEMQEWVRDRVQQILALQPQRILEIGCGTGLLLFQLAPHCQTYVGTDFSVVSLESIRQQLPLLNLPQVELQNRLAHDFDGIAPASFDVVILNSIVQYFPSQDYLVNVLAGAMQALAPGGVLFVGDVRSLPLLTAFHTWMKFSQAEASVERSQLRQQVERSQFEEPELAIDPVFFYALRDRFPQMQHVHIRLSRGRSQNEMTQFRYNVLLHLAPSQSGSEQALSLVSKEFHGSNQPVQVCQSTQYHNWKVNPITVEAIHEHLLQDAPEILVVTNVTNSRVHTATHVAHWLHHQTSPKTVGRMREILPDIATAAIDPQDWWDIETVLPYTVEITWAASPQTGDYDVHLTRQGITAIVDSALAQSIRPSSPNDTNRHDTNRHYTNEPLQANFARQLIPELQQHLRHTLPDYMVPSAFVPLATLPLTINGKVDRIRLAEESRSNFTAINKERSSTISTPSTPTEITLTKIWKDLLRLKQIDRHDNFFELGGHSLLATQLTSRVRDAFGLELPLKSVFAAPTIAQLASILETRHDNTSAPQIPPLVHLDRSRYRRKRSTLAIPSPEIPPALSTPTIHHAVRSPLVPLSLGGNKSPFFCVHPMFGVVFPYLELAHHLGDDRSFYGLQPLGLDGKSAPLNRMEAIAAYYVQAIQTLQPHGPYFLGGWSFGGLVAFEMAQQLIQAGEQVAFLAILDTPAPCHRPSFYQSLKFLLGTALWSTLPFLLDYGALASDRLQSRHAWIARWQWSTIGRLIPTESRLQLLDESAIAPLLRIVYANSEAVYRYKPQKYGDRLTLFQATEGFTTREHDLYAGWHTLANNIQLHRVPGNHLSLLKHPHVETLAQQIHPYLA